MALSDITEALTGWLPFGDTTLRIGVTGLSRAGKTVFITGLVANLIDRGRMPQLVARGRILAAFLQPQPDLTLPRFPYEEHLAAMTGDDPRWPEGTRALSELRLSLRLAPSGMLGAARTLHLDIIDYPGEWLMDLSLLEKSYAQWAEGTLDRINRRPSAADFLAAARAEDASLPFDEGRAAALAQSYTRYLAAARAAGHADCAPGRFLLPGELAGSPVLTFAPLPMPAATPRGSIWAEMQRRYDGYVARVVRPFFRDHFARIDRQVVLADVLGAIHGGPPAVEELRQSLTDVLAAFRPGRNSWLASIFGGRRVERILFAATKADHLHHTQHPRLSAITAALLSDAKARADFAGAATAAMSIASLRATVEDEVRQGGEVLPAVRGRLMNGRTAVMYPGDLPEDPARLLSPARDGAARWLDAEYGLMTFLPARISRTPGDGPPHIRLDRAAQFLIGDRL